VSPSEGETHSPGGKGRKKEVFFEEIASEVKEEA